MTISTRQAGEHLLTALLVAIGIHGLHVQLLGFFQALPYCWIGGLLVLAGLSGYKLRLFRHLSPSSRKELFSAWLSPWPWLVLILLATQIALYPPTMSDSLCYRLPRLFLALQEGRITRFDTPDARMNGMPWGWEMLALPFAALNLLNASKLINFTCWALIHQLLHSLLRQHDVPSGRARWISLVFATAPAFVLQATSTANDLYAATLLLAGVWMIFRFTKSPGPVPVLASLLSLLLAANAKPQFLVLGLPWLVWWAFAPGKPWKQTPWWVLAIAAPLYFLVSPLPILIGNITTTGNLLANDPGTAPLAKPPAHLMVLAGSIQFLFTQIQIPLLPKTIGLHGLESIGNLVPGFQPESKPLFMIDWASFGLVHFIMMGAGTIGCLRGRIATSWPWLLAVLFAFVVSVSQIVPTTIGRSFVGFLVPLLPLAAFGLSRIRSQLVFKATCATAILTGLAAIVLNPSSPLWPSDTVMKAARGKGMEGLAAKLEEYNSYQKRAKTGLGMLSPVPHGEPVGILLRQITPASLLWQPDWRAHRIHYVNHVSPESFAEGGTRWLVVAEKAAEFFPQQALAYSHLPGWVVVDQKEYLPNLSQGPERWTLYHKATR